MPVKPENKARICHIEGCDRKSRNKGNPDTAGFIGAGLTLGDLRAARRTLAALRAQYAPVAGPSQAALDVLAERQRQISAEGWTPEHDDQHNDGEIAGAAATYALSAAEYIASVPYHRTWPWQTSWWKPTTPRRDLVKAGALILAEIERLDRAAPVAGEGGE